MVSKKNLGFVAYIFRHWNLLLPQISLLPDISNAFSLVAVLPLPTMTAAAVAVAAAASLRFSLAPGPLVHRSRLPLLLPHLCLTFPRQFDFCRSRQLCSHKKATVYVLRTQVKVEDGIDDETCELVNGIELSIGEGEDIIHGYLFKAVKNNNGTGLVLLSDVFGFEDSSTRDFAYRIACNGYNVLVPDLFRGNPWKKGKPVAEFEHWLSQQPPERVARDIELSTKWFIEEFTAAGISKKLGVVGFCFGGGHLIETLAKDNSSYFATGVCFYGTRISTSLAEEINVPVLFICGDSDSLCPADIVSEMEKRIKGSRAVIYHGRGHDFAHRPESQEEDSDAEDAFNVLRSWLKDGLVLDEVNAVASNLVA